MAQAVWRGHIRRVMFIMKIQSMQILYKLRFFHITTYSHSQNCLNTHKFIFFHIHTYFHTESIRKSINIWVNQQFWEVLYVVMLNSSNLSGICIDTARTNENAVYSTHCRNVNVRKECCEITYFDVGRQFCLEIESLIFSTLSHKFKHFFFLKSRKYWFLYLYWKFLNLLLQFDFL